MTTEYNKFVALELRRLKTMISGHREAFRTAARNWTDFRKLLEDHAFDEAWKLYADRMIPNVAVIGFGAELFIGKITTSEMVPLKSGKLEDLCTFQIYDRSLGHKSMDGIDGFIVLSDPTMTFDKPTLHLKQIGSQQMGVDFSLYSLFGYKAVDEFLITLSKNKGKGKVMDQEVP